MEALVHEARGRAAGLQCSLAQAEDRLAEALSQIRQQEEEQV
jgi:hypothetical protein